MKVRRQGERYRDGCSRSLEHEKQADWFLPTEPDQRMKGHLRTRLARSGSHSWHNVHYGDRST